MINQPIKQLLPVLALMLGLAFTTTGGAARAQAPAPVALPGVVVRRVVMKDALSAESFKQKLDQMKATGLFRDLLPGADPKNPANLIEISFLTSGNYLVVAGGRKWVDGNIDSIRMMGYLFERPRAHLQLNLRVVQLTGPANANVIQMSETVRALVDAQREEVVRTFSELDDYLTARMQERMGEDATLQKAVQELLPSLGTGVRPLTVPEILMLVMLDRTSPRPKGKAAGAEAGPEDPQAALLDLSRALAVALLDPHRDETRVVRDVADELAAWKKTVTSARDWCGHFGEELKKGKDGTGIGSFREGLEQPDCPVPAWLIRRLKRSIDVTERLYPNLLRKHTEQVLRELQRRFTGALERVRVIEQAIARGDVVTLPAPEEGAPAGKDAKPKSEGEKAVLPGQLGRNLLALKSLADEMVPSPLALFESMSLAADNGAPTPQQLLLMFREYTVERRRLDERLAAEDQTRSVEVNYARLQALEATLNLWLRRVSEAMGRALEQRFYRRYVNELRVLANQQLGKSSSRDLLAESNIGEVPDVARDLLLADTGVNVFLTNSISLQFAPDTTNTVAAQVQASLPSKLGIMERIQQAEQATKSFNTLSQAFGINGESVVKALLAGGQAVPVQGGINLSASPSIGFDASTVTLSITANQTLAPGNEKVTDRVTNHSINNATVTALSYEPMVLSTLASNVSYYEDTGGIPVLRKAPILKDLLKDIPFAPFKQGKRQKGVYQSSVIILEPVVIPTIEDLVRFHGGWREGAAVPARAPAVVVKPNGN